MEPAKLSVCLDLLTLMQNLKALMGDIAEKYGMTGIQLGALYVISENPTSMGKVAQLLHCDASNATGIVDRLVSLGLVERRECEHDRRSKLLELTARGEAVIQEIKAKLPEHLGCSRLSDVECKVIRSLASKFAVN